MYRNDGKCKLCKTIESKRTHIFMDCIITKQILDQFTDFLRAFVDIDITHKEVAFGIFEYTNNKTNLRNYLTFTIRHIVYRNRNNEFSANANIPQILKNKIIKYIKNDLELKFNIAKEKNKTALFEERFLENNVLGKIENGELLTNMWS